MFRCSVSAIYPQRCSGVLWVQSTHRDVQWVQSTHRDVQWVQSTHRDVQESFECSLPTQMFSEYSLPTQMFSEYNLPTEMLKLKKIPKNLISSTVACRLHLISSSWKTKDRSLSRRGAPHPIPSSQSSLPICRSASTTEDYYSGTSLYRPSRLTSKRGLDEGWSVVRSLFTWV